MTNQPIHPIQLAEQITNACATTKPRTKARNKALAAVKWVLRASDGTYAALGDKLNVKLVADVSEAVTFDGRDNEQAKADFYGAVTGLTFEVVLV